MSATDLTVSGPAAPRPKTPAPVASGAPAGVPRLTPSWLAAQGRLPLAFMGLGTAWFAAAAAATAMFPSLFTLPHIAPPVLALTHAWVLGFFVTIAAGAMYQLAPVALGTTLWSERTGWWHFGVHAAAVPLLVFAFARWNLPLLGVAGSLVVSGVVVFAVNQWATVYRSGKRDAVAWSLVLATGWLLLTVTAGLLLVANRAWGWLPVDPLPLLRAHAHLGLIGFFVTLLQGVTFRLVPMFTLAEVPDWRPVRIGLWLTQLGLVGLAPALALHAGYWAAGFSTMILAGMLASGWALRRTLATRKKRQLDPGVRALVRGAVGVVVAAAAGLWLVWPTTFAGSVPGGLSATVYGILVLGAALLPAVAGMMGKIVPFLTWMRAYGPKVGRQPTPPATALSNPRLETWALTLQSVAMIPLVAGAWTLSVPLAQAGGVVLAIGAGLFIANLGLVVKHLWRPVNLPAATKKPLPR